MTEVNKTHTVKKGECAWNVAQKNLKAKGQKASNADIAKEMKRLAKLNGCDSVEDFSQKYFSKAGSKFICDKGEKNVTSQPPRTKRDSTTVLRKDSALIAKVDNTRVSISDSTRLAGNDSTKTARDTTRTRVKTPKISTQAQEMRNINRIPDSKSRIIEYNKKHASGNYIIVDKKTCKATVYNKAGKPLQSYEVILGASKGDDLSTAYAADQDLARAGRRTVPGEFKLNFKQSDFGGLYSMGAINETMDPDAKMREWAPGQWNKKRFRGNVLQAIHNTADRTHRDKLYGDGNIANNRASLGCVNIQPHHMKELEAKYGIGQGTNIYILPETKGNELVLTKQKDGTIKFITKYKDQKQNEKLARIQTAIADKNIQRQLAYKRKQEQQQLAEQQRKANEFDLFKPDTWFS